ncbi:MAG: hypothetical protein C0467_31515 [Planctomycetaceae bacterium]|nr:hypothetical protein [Planctomycetaceae bacterium]
MSQGDAKQPADLTARERRMAAMVASGCTHEEVAAACRVSRATVTRAAKRPGFRELVTELHTAAANLAAGEFLEGAKEAGKVLRNLMNDGTPDAVRVSAAKAVADYALRFHTVTDLSAEIAALREQIEEQGQRPATPTASEVRALAPPALPEPEAQRDPGEPPPAVPDDDALFE